jgi:nucleoside-diphosphate kinase
MTERTLSIIKPDAVADGNIGQIIGTFEANGLTIMGARLVHLSLEQAQEFYSVHHGKDFFKRLTEFMSAGPIFVSILEGENAVLKNRELMGATDPKQAAEETIRARFGRFIGNNAVHGSDSLENAKTEIKFFFSENQIHPRTFTPEG